MISASTPERLSPPRKPSTLETSRTTRQSRRLVAKTALDPDVHFSRGCPYFACDQERDGEQWVDATSVARSVACTWAVPSASQLR